MKKILLCLIMLNVTNSWAAETETYKNFGITFIKNKNITAEKYSQIDYNQKLDPAEIDSYFKNPQFNNELSKLQQSSFDQMTQEELDQIYFRASSGPIIAGDYLGSVVIKGELLNKIRNTLSSRLGVDLFKKFMRLICQSDDIKCIAEHIWGGKQIHEVSANRPEGRYYLRNAINPLDASAIRAFLGGILDTLRSAIDGHLTLNTSDTFNGQKKAMLFPAKVYCGQSLLDHRKESIVIDYAWGKDFTSDGEFARSEYKPWIDPIDKLAGPGYLDIRDEIRMVKPGLYLGRAYSNKVFLLNFVLQASSQTPTGIENTCVDMTTVR